MSILERQVNSSSNFASFFIVITHNSSVFIHFWLCIKGSHQSQFSFKFCTNFQCHQTYLLCSFLAQLLYTLFKRNPLKCKFLWPLTQPANIGPQDVPRTTPSNVLRTSPKDPIWPSQGHLDLTSGRHPELMSWGRPEITSRGRCNLTFKGRPWEVDSGHPQDVLRTSPRRPSNHALGKIWVHQLNVPKFIFLFLSELIRFTKST